MIQFLRYSIVWLWAAPLALATLPALSALPATVTITGRVVNTKGAPLAGVFIVMQNAATTATTNASGNFLLTSEQAKPVLTFKCAGYQTQTFLLKALGPVTVTMNEVGTVLAASSAGLEVVSKPLVVADDQPTFPGARPPTVLIYSRMCTTPRPPEPIIFPAMCLLASWLTRPAACSMPRS
ncbi:carboxypeptidase regulatory-like domain-containing protein [Hymenobacter sp. BRD67]|uniref:carboxypeptidase regulatory-like domain-containing protein n=1 Tax=Hymenobacter sp. BRD67 TaxID=2675877 RepID=UPI0015634106|nr:carboxypeptidase regulatory-like domain-containing protein [Hymenobacter sp. BRD67]QKG52904.1 carboxypeptidase-like regulatory domain-containing protein [Hymenobacter sp. BRD67]